MLRTFISIELVKSQSNYSLRQLACPPRSRSSDPFHTLRKHQVVVGQKSGCLNCSFLPHFVEAYLPWSICKKVGFFFVYSTTQTLTTRTHTHPYEHRYANPTCWATAPSRRLRDPKDARRFTEDGEASKSSSRSDVRR